MKKSKLFVSLFAMGLFACTFVGCDDDEEKEESCSAATFCDDSEEVTACCVDNTCTYTYNGTTYSDSEDDQNQLATDLGCSEDTGGEDTGGKIGSSHGAIVAKLQVLLEEAKAGL